MPLLKEKLTLWMELLPKDHPRVVFVMCNLALTYYRLKMYNKAASLWEQSIELANKVFHKVRSEHHAFIGNAMYKLAGTYLRLDKHKEVLNLFDQLLTITNGFYHRSTPKSKTLCDVSKKLSVRKDTKPNVY